MMRRSELSNALDSVVNLDEYGSIQWHYLSYKSPIANGRFLDRSSIGIRPFIQHSLFQSAEINPFKQEERRANYASRHADFAKSRFISY